MSRKKELQKQLGSGYIYERYLDEWSLRQLKRQPPEDFSEKVIASLTAGCLRLNAVAYRACKKLLFGYDVLAVSYTHLIPKGHKIEPARRFSERLLPCV